MSLTPFLKLWRQFFCFISPQTRRWSAHKPSSSISDSDSGKAGRLQSINSPRKKPNTLTPRPKSPAITPSQKHLASPPKSFRDRCQADWLLQSNQPRFTGATTRGRCGRDHVTNPLVYQPSALWFALSTTALPKATMIAGQLPLNSAGHPHSIWACSLQLIPFAGAKSVFCRPVATFRARNIRQAESFRGKLKLLLLGLEAYGQMHTNIKRRLTTEPLQLPVPPISYAWTGP